jgi:hypothetical protein
MPKGIVLKQILLRSTTNSCLEECWHVGEITRRGYRIEWFIGDHGPRHVHVYDSKERFLGRLDIERMRGIEGWMPARKLIKVIEELKREGRL